MFKKCDICKIDIQELHIAIPFNHQFWCDVDDMLEITYSRELLTVCMDCGSNLNTSVISECIQQVDTLFSSVDN
jgi:hypothetical protein